MTKWQQIYFNTSTLFNSTGLDAEKRDKTGSTDKWQDKGQFNKWCWKVYQYGEKVVSNNITSWTKLILDELSMSYQRQNFNILNGKHKRN